MTNVFTFMQNILVSVFAASFVFVSVYVPQPLNHIEKAEAQQIVSDLIGHTLQILNNIYTIAMHAFQQALANKELVLDGILFALAKAILESITNNIVRWVNSGLDGDPYFIQDLRSTLADVASQELEYYLDEINGPNSFICEPFRMDISIALAEAYEERENGYPQGGACDPSGPMANIEEFYDGNFEAGGWEAWYEMVNRPEQYTSYGSYLAADRRAGELREEARRTQITEANWSDGFFSRKVCTAPTTPYGRPTCKVITPGDSIAESLNFHLSSGSRVLIEADEINELLGSLLAYIAQNVITGAGGLLGYSGGGDDGGDGGDDGGDGGGDSSIFDNLINLVSESRNDHINWLNNVVREYEVELTALANDPNAPESARTAARSEADRINQVIIPDLRDNIDALTELYDVLIGYANNPPANPTAALNSATREYNDLLPDLFTTGEISSLISTWNSILGG